MILAILEWAERPLMALAAIDGDHSYGGTRGY